MAESDFKATKNTIEIVSPAAVVAYWDALHASPCLAPSGRFRWLRNSKALRLLSLWAHRHFIESSAFA